MFDLSAAETAVVTGGTIAGLRMFNPTSSSTFRITGESNSDVTGTQTSYAVDNFQFDTTVPGGVNFQELDTNATWHDDTYLGLGIGSGILANLSDSNANITSLGAYSIWFDEKGETGHILIGGINKAKFTHLLNTYYTITPDNTMSIELLNISIALGVAIGVSIAVGQFLALDFAFFTSLPEQVATQIWDVVGAQYDWNINATAMILIIPCSYKKNTSTITFVFQDYCSGYSNVAKIALKDLIIQNGTGPYYDELGSSHIGSFVMKSLYTVYDTSNRVLSLATVNSSSALDNIVRIPYGGVNNLYSAPTTLSSSGSSGGFPGLPGELGTGLGIIWLTLVKKAALLEDIKAFLDPETRVWYSRRGIPYRKGYLLYGPSGTGKSSLSLSIAGACDLDIYILNVSSVDDSSLGELFTELPAHCVILLEDIDAVDATQSRQRGTVKTGQDETSSSTKGKSQGRVSLSALPNVLDSVGSQEGRVLIMTTNHTECLDAALIRPGRVDMKLELEYTNQDINARLFCAVFMRDDPLQDRSRRGDEVTLRKLMTEFANKIPEQEFSPAEIQSFLLEYGRSPHMAVENVQEWVLRTREDEKANKESRFLGASRRR